MEITRMAAKSFKAGLANQKVKEFAQHRAANTLEEITRECLEIEAELRAAPTEIPKDELYCTHCKKPGHRFVDCRKKPKEGDDVGRVAAILTALGMQIPKNKNNSNSSNSGNRPNGNGNGNRSGNMNRNWSNLNFRRNGNGNGNGNGGYRNQNTNRFNNIRRPQGNQQQFNGQSGNFAPNQQQFNGQSNGYQPNFQPNQGSFAYRPQMPMMQHFLPQNMPQNTPQTMQNGPMVTHNAPSNATNQHMCNQFNSGNL